MLKYYTSSSYRSTYNCLSKMAVIGDATLMIKKEKYITIAAFFEEYKNKLRRFFAGTN